MQLLKHAELEPYNAELTAGLDLETFIAESEKTGGSMVGSQRLVWPEDPEKILGLTLLLIQKFGANPDYAIEFSRDFFYSGNKVISSRFHALSRRDDLAAYQLKVVNSLN